MSEKVDKIYNEVKVHGQAFKEKPVDNSVWEKKFAELERKILAQKTMQLISESNSLKKKNAFSMSPKRD